MLRVASIPTHEPHSDPFSLSAIQPRPKPRNPKTQRIAQSNSSNLNAQEPTQKALALLTTQPTHIISSPYANPQNQLNLQSLSTPSQLLAIALTALAPIRADYATADYLSSFNWTTVFSILQTLCLSSAFDWHEQEFYLVIFRSRLKADADRERLGELDQRSHEEACASGGLLKYWFGSTDGERRNLATCIWRNREDAAAGGKGPWHAKARGSARVMYETISFHTFRFVVEEGAKGWRLEGV